MYIPSVMTLDFETALTDGTPTVEMYRKEARVITASFAYRNSKGEISTKYKIGEENIETMLRKCKQLNIPIVVHNYQFEFLCLVTRFKGLEDILKVDTMRLVQMYDNGGRGQEEYYPAMMNIEDHLAYLEGKYVPKSGLGLGSSISRILPKEENYKKQYKDLITSRGGKGFKDLNLLTPEELEKYNTLDAIVTLKLYEALVKEFENLNIDWKKDHKLYISTAQQVTFAKIQGIKIDKEKLKDHITSKENALKEIKDSFRAYFSKEIEILEKRYSAEYLDTFKSTKGRIQASEKLKEVPIVFNTRSNKQLKELFCDTLNMTPKYFTKKGSPSFAAKFLSQWGEGGELLKGQKRALVELKQGEALDKLSDYDGRWHVDIKAAGTATNRLAGGSHSASNSGARLNIQGLSRGCSSLMSCLVADEGHKFVSIDLCYPDYTEFLTRTGWKRFNDIDENEEIWEVNPITLQGSWCVPKRRISYNFSGEMVTYTTTRGSLEVTEGHRMLWVGQQSHSRKDKEHWRNISYAGRDEELKTIQHFSHFTDTNSISNYSTKEIWIACMLHADGYFNKKYGKYTIQVNKDRKKLKIKELLGKEGITSKTIRINQTMLTTTWNYITFSSNLLMGKSFNLDTLGSNQVDEFVEALKFWDGSNSSHNSRSNRIIWGSANEVEVDKVQSFLVRSGYEARKSTYNNNNFYTLSIKKKGTTRFSIVNSTKPSGSCKSSTKIYTKVQDKPVVCFEVDQGFLLVRQKGQTFVSSNCAGEPTVTTHYSKDPNYHAANFGMVGKKPYYDNNGVLQISDIYLMGASVSPLAKDKMKTYFNQEWEGKSFGGQWLKDDEIIKRALKKEIRQLHKRLVLGLGYSMGPKKMVESAFEDGYALELKDAKAFFNAYWRLFPKVKLLGDILQNRLKKGNGRIVNEFGYCLKPDKEYKILNYWIQSSVTGIMHLLTAKFAELCPEAKFLTVIHDEVIYQFPTDKEDYCKQQWDKALDWLNNLLNWSVKMRTGWVTGTNMYEAK